VVTYLKISKVSYVYVDVLLDQIAAYMFKEPEIQNAKILATDL